MICQCNNQVIADGISHVWPVALVGADASLGTYDAANYIDELHLNTTGIVKCFPYFVGAVGESLANTPRAAYHFRRRRAG